MSVGERRNNDRELGMIIQKIEGLENKMDGFISDFKHQCESKHKSLDEYIRNATDKVPISNCNDRMSITERIVSRHTVYWGVFITIMISTIPIAFWVINHISAR